MKAEKHEKNKAQQEKEQKNEEWCDELKINEHALLFIPFVSFTLINHTTEPLRYPRYNSSSSRRLILGESGLIKGLVFPFLV